MYGIYQEQSRIFHGFPVDYRMLKAEGSVDRLGPRCNEMCGAVRTLACDGCDGGAKLLRSGSQPQACHRKQSNLSVF